MPRSPLRRTSQRAARLRVGCRARSAAEADVRARLPASVSIDVGWLTGRRRTWAVENWTRPHAQREKREERERSGREERGWQACSSGSRLIVLRPVRLVLSGRAAGSGSWWSARRRSRGRARGPWPRPRVTSRATLARGRAGHAQAEVTAVGRARHSGRLDRLGARHSAPRRPGNLAPPLPDLHRDLRPSPNHQPPPLQDSRPEGQRVLSVSVILDGGPG